MSSKALLIATATLLSLSAVSCGNNDAQEDSVSISLSEEITATKETSVETETTTESSTTAETTASTTESDTETDSTTTVQSSETEDTETTTSTVAETPQQEEVTTQPDLNNQPAETEAPTEAPTEEPPAPTESPAQPDPSEPVRFKIEDLLTDASGIISALGTPNQTGGGAACLTNGHDDKIYQYDGLEIECYIDGDSEYIFLINITGGDYETDRGIKIGSSREDVETAYGTGTQSGNMIIYSSGNSEMDIQYGDNNTVIAIFFYTPI